MSAPSLVPTTTRPFARAGATGKRRLGARIPQLLAGRAGPTHRPRHRARREHAAVLIHRQAEAEPQLLALAADARIHARCTRSVPESPRAAPRGSMSLSFFEQAPSAASSEATATARTVRRMSARWPVAGAAAGAGVGCLEVIDLQLRGLRVDRARIRARERRQVFLQGAGLVALRKEHIAAHFVEARLEQRRPACRSGWRARHPACSGPAARAAQARDEGELVVLRALHDASQQRVGLRQIVRFDGETRFEQVRLIDVRRVRIILGELRRRSPSRASGRSSAGRPSSAHSGHSLRGPGDPAGPSTSSSRRASASATTTPPRIHGM